MMLRRLGGSLRLIRTRLLLVIIASGLGIHLLLAAAYTANRAILADAKMITAETLADAAKKAVAAAQGA